MLFTILRVSRSEAATMRKDAEKAKTIYEIVLTMLLHLACAKADHIDPNQTRGLLSPLYRFFCT